MASATSCARARRSCRRFRASPLFGGIQRSWLDVALYAANQLFLLRALVAPEITADLLWPSVVLIPLMGIGDKTLFLAARAEHYWVALTCIAVALAGDGPWISFCKLVWCFIWFWAATSKVNHHFPSVIQVMMNNGPFFPKWLKKRLFVSYPDDLRPAPLAVLMARMGTLTEWTIPFVLAANISPLVTGLMLFVMVGFHGFIAINNPSGMPIEWNILMIYGGIALFGFHPEASILATGSDAAPARVRAVLHVRRAALRQLRAVARLVPARDALLRGQLGLQRLADPQGRDREAREARRRTPRPRACSSGGCCPTPSSSTWRSRSSLAHRFMHLEGRPLLEALPRAVDRIDDYEWIDGEMFAGMVLGWNFGDGHLNNESLLDAMQQQCRFAPGELRVVMVESQPLFGPTMQWKIVDAANGVLEEGETEIDPMRAVQPYPTGRVRGGVRARAGESHGISRTPWRISTPS